MEPAQLVLPTIATIAFGAALLVPLRDDRRGRRATLRGKEPLRPDFGALDAAATIVSETRDEPLADLANDGVAHLRVEDRVALTPPAPDEPRDLECELIERPEDAGEPMTRPTGRLRGALDRLRTILARKSDGDASTPCVELVSTLADATGSETALERSFYDEVKRLLTPGPISLAACERVGEREGELELGHEPERQREPERDAPEATQLSCDAHGVAPPDAIIAEPPTLPVVARLPSGVPRVVPLTRLPLRPHAGDVAWPKELHPDRPAISRDERHAILATLLRGGGDSDSHLLERAYAEEDAKGRCLALRALLRSAASPHTRGVFLDALKNGSDEERAIAIDALTMHGERADVTPALNDRVDAIAAQAALTYVGSNRREDYRRELSIHVDATRIDSILTLLAGIVE